MVFGMGLKYADLEIRWSGLRITKKNGRVTAEVDAELGYYDSQGWHTVSPYGTYSLDLPALQVMIGLPPQGNTLAEAIDRAIYGFLGKTPPYYTKLSIPGIPSGATGTVSVEVEGRGTITAQVGELPLSFPPAPKGRVTVNLVGYEPQVWEGPLVGEVNLDLTFTPRS